MEPQVDRLSVEQVDGPMDLQLSGLSVEQVDRQLTRSEVEGKKTPQLADEECGEENVDPKDGQTSPQLSDEECGEGKGDPKDGQKSPQLPDEECGLKTRC